MAQLPKGLKLQRIGEETQGRGGGEGAEQQGHAPVAAHRAQGEHRHPAESIADDAAEYYMYEAFYSYPVNDGMTVTPVVYVKEAAAADETGVMVKTSFSF